MKNTTIMEVLRPIKNGNVTNIIKKYKADAFAKKLTTLNLITLFLLADLKEFDGLRAISTDLLFDDAYQECLNLDSISHTQLYRRLTSLNPEVLREIFEYLVMTLKNNHKNIRLSDDIPALNIVDASIVLKAIHGMEWAKYRKNKAGIKLNLGIRYHNSEHVYPNKATITRAKDSDVRQMKDLVDYTEGVINVFDRGYNNYQYFDEITDNKGLFVIRLKENAITWMNTVFECDSVGLAAKGRIGAGSKKTKHEYYYVQIKDDQGKTMHFLTNIKDLESVDTGLSFSDIGDIYKLRWQVELFFKWIKQHFKVKHFFGTGESAVSNQIYLNLIMYCLLALFKQTIVTKASLNKLRIAIRASFYTCIEKFKVRLLKLNPY